jgi:hypothetical protein
MGEAQIVNQHEDALRALPPQRNKAMTHGHGALHQHGEGKAMVHMQILAWAGRNVKKILT